jgi:phage-related protein
MFSKKLSITLLAIVFIVSSFKSSDAGWFNNVIDTISDGVDDAVDTVSDGVDDAVDTISDGVDDAVDTVSDGVDNLVDDSKKIVDNSVSTLTDFTTKTYEEAKDKIEDFIENIQNQTVLDAFKSEMKQLVSSFVSNTDLTGCLKKQQCSFCQDIDINSLGIDTKGNQVTLLLFSPILIKPLIYSLFIFYL